MKVCVFGAGAIGGNLAARLAGTDAEVSVIARGDHLAAIRPLELDAMFTVPAEFGKLLGVKTPLLDLMVALMRLRARGAGL